MSSDKPTNMETDGEDQVDLSENVIEKNPDLHVAQLRFLVGHSAYDAEAKKRARRELMDKIEELEMAPYYKDMCTELGLKLDEALYKRLQAKNAAKLEEMEKAIKDAVENLSETDVKDAWLKKAEYMCSIGDKDACLSAFRQTYEKVVGIGHQLDLVFQLIRVGLFYLDHTILSANFAKAKDLIASGGDWDRKNRLKVYEGVYALSIRDFRRAADLLLDCVSTFTSTELLTYEKLVFYAVAAGMMTLDRQELKNKVIQGAEVQEQLYTMPELRKFLHGLYDCDYHVFFEGLAWIEQQLKFDRIAGPHYTYYVRSMRALAYKELLRSYRSLTLGYMAKTFGVTVDFIDKELYQLIAAGHLYRSAVIINNLPISAYKQLMRSYRSLTLGYMAKTFGVTMDFIDKELHQLIAAGHLYRSAVIINNLLPISAYKQLLRSYRSLTLGYMAKTFGVTVDFIDKELHQMIAAGHLYRS